MEEVGAKVSRQLVFESENCEVTAWWGGWGEDEEEQSPWPVTWPTSTEFSLQSIPSARPPGGSMVVCFHEKCCSHCRWVMAGVTVRISSPRLQTPCKVRGEPGEASEQEIPPKYVISPSSICIKSIPSRTSPHSTSCVKFSDSFGHHGCLFPRVIVNY